MYFSLITPILELIESGNLQCDSHTLIYSGHKKEDKHRYGKLLSNAVSRSVMGYHAMSDRILLVMIQGQACDLSIIQVYAHTIDSTEGKYKISIVIGKMHMENVATKRLSL